jgi:predicted nucleic acid-binding protein
MKTEIAIDSSLLVALIYPEDNWHSKALTLWTAIKKAGYTTIFFDCVAAEALSAALRRLQEKKRLSEVETLFNQLNFHVSPDKMTWILPDVPRLYSEIIQLMQSSGGALNFNDALIALACRERQIPAIASFDTDFDQIDWLHRFASPEDINDFQNLK